MSFILSVISLAAIVSMLLPAYGQSIDKNFKVFVVDDDAIRELDLRATQAENGQTKRVSGFSIQADSVVQLKQGENLRIFTSDNDPSKITSVKITPQDGETIKLVKEGSTWSLQGFGRGAYLLDVIVTLPNGGKGAFETVLVILGPLALEANPTQVIKQVIENKNIVNVDVTKKFIDVDTDKGRDRDRDRDDKKPPRSNNPYCDLVPDDYTGSCHDRKDYDEETGLYPCRDGSNVKDWRDCKDAGKHPDEKKEPERGRMCTMGMDAGSLACREGISVDQYCAKNPSTQGCPGAEVPQPEPEPTPQEPAILPPCENVAPGTTCDNTADEDSTLDPTPLPEPPIDTEPAEIPEEEPPTEFEDEGAAAADQDEGEADFESDEGEIEEETESDNGDDGGESESEDKGDDGGSESEDSGGDEGGDEQQGE